MLCRIAFILNYFRSDHVYCYCISQVWGNYVATREPLSFYKVLLGHTKLKNKWGCFFLSIHAFYIYPVQGRGEMETIPASIRQKPLCLFIYVSLYLFIMSISGLNAFVFRIVWHAGSTLSPPHHNIAMAIVWP